MFLRRLALYCVLSTLYLHSAWAKQASIPSIEKNSKIQISAELAEWNQKQKIILLEHQIRPIQYLEKNRHIPGLVINHGLGTGKTYLAIGYAERCPQHSVIIFCPDFLKGHWMTALKEYGVKDISRFHFVSHDQPTFLLHQDLSNTLVIIDESHRFIEKVRSGLKDSSKYSRLYSHLRKANKVLSLTGTPVYNDIYDLTYQINLVSRNDVLPFNEQRFQSLLFQVNHMRAFWRGQMIENFATDNFALRVLWHILTGPMLSNAFGMFSAASQAYSYGSMQLFLKIGYHPSIYPLKAFQPEKMRTFIQDYISYYNFDQDARWYPEKVFAIHELDYTKKQYKLLYKFLDSRLHDHELQQVLKDQISEDAIHKDHISLNSTALQDNYKAQIGSGREIGNFPIASATDPIVNFPQKFHDIFQMIESSHGPAVVYSNYYYNGLLYFKQFLDAKNYQNKYRIFHIGMTSEEQIKVVQDFNEGKVKILLLHPKITEGISLKGTQQLHFLEVPTSSALRDQIVGRAIRYRSHEHLPKDQQQVHVIYWMYKMRWLDINYYTNLRKNWHLYRREANLWGLLSPEFDKNYSLKNKAPDEIAWNVLNTMNAQYERFKYYAAEFSIEQSDKN